jgi:hypothetical protein
VQQQRASVAKMQVVLSKLVCQESGATWALSGHGRSLGGTAATTTTGAIALRALIPPGGCPLRTTLHKTNFSFWSPPLPPNYNVERRTGGRKKKSSPLWTFKSSTLCLGVRGGSEAKYCGRWNAPVTFPRPPSTCH